MTAAKPKSPSTMTLAELISTQKRRSKYGSRKTEYKGDKYDSLAEARRAAELDVLVKGGKISGWERQVPYVITVNGVYICTYLVDFRVTENDSKAWVEDVKGYATPVYRLKKKLFAACYPHIDFREMRA